jgi:hypothetical protein
MLLTAKTLMAMLAECARAALTRAPEPSRSSCRYRCAHARAAALEDISFTDATMSKGAGERTGIP